MRLDKRQVHRDEYGCQCLNTRISNISLPKCFPDFSFGPKAPNSFEGGNVGSPEIGGPTYTPRNSIILTIGTLKKGLLSFGNPTLHLALYGARFHLFFYFILHYWALSRPLILTCPSISLYIPIEPCITFVYHSIVLRSSC